MSLRRARDNITNNFVDRFKHFAYGPRYRYESNDFPEITLTANERRRLYRAIYRWQIYCNLFPGGDSLIGDFFHDLDGSYFDFDERKSLFFTAFAPWEFEEFMILIQHVYRMYDNLHFTWGLLLPTFGLQAALAPQEDRTNLLNLNPHTADDADDTLRIDRIDWLMNQGPHFFHRAICTPWYTRDFVELFLDNFNTTLFPIYGVYIAAASIDRSLPLSQHLASQDQQSLEFYGDDVADDPNRG